MTQEKKKEKKMEKRNEDQEVEIHENKKKQTKQGDYLWPRVAEPWDAVQSTMCTMEKWKNGIFAPCKTVDLQIVALPSDFR